MPLASMGHETLMRQTLTQINMTENENKGQQKQTQQARQSQGGDGTAEVGMD